MSGVRWFTCELSMKSSEKMVIGTVEKSSALTPCSARTQARDTSCQQPACTACMESIVSDEARSRHTLLDGRKHTQSRLGEKHLTMGRKR